MDPGEGCGRGGHGAGAERAELEKRPVESDPGTEREEKVPEKPDKT